MKTYNLCFAGFGNVGRALTALLEKKRADLRERYGIEWRITGIASRRLGWRAQPDGFPVPDLLNGTFSGSTDDDIHDWLEVCRAHVLFEMTSLNRETGEPAITHLRAALEHGAHAISANKGPIIYAYQQLRQLAEKRERSFLFESTVMDGVPVFSMFRENLPALHVHGFRAILNSTTNVVLDEIEQGADLQAAIRRAQEIGVAETDPSDDLEGWDAAVKVAALSTVILGGRLRLDEIEREEITKLTTEEIRTARGTGRPYKLLCRAQRQNDDGVLASVRPEQIEADDPLAFVNGTSSAIYFQTDIFPGLAITEINPGLEATAYGLLADFVRAVT